MNKKRPVNLDIRTIQLPLTALTSILHRISGIMLFIFLGLILYMLSKSLESEKGFNEVKEIFSSPFGKGHCCKVSDEAAFCLIQRPYISKTLLTRRISPRGSP